MAAVVDDLDGNICQSSEGWWKAIFVNQDKSSGGLGNGYKLTYLARCERSRTAPVFFSFRGAGDLLFR